MQEDLQQDLRDAGQSSLTTSGKTQVLGLDFKTAGILCYLPICAVNLISSLVFVASEPKSNRFLRFHAMQSLVMCAIYLVLAIGTSIVTLVLGMIPVLGAIIGLVLNLAFLVVTGVFIWQSVVGMIAASKGEIKHIPIVGEIAEQRLV